jgi:chloride channel 7
VLVGTILRKTICTLLKHKAFAPSSFDPADGSLRMFPLVAWGTLECIYPRYPDLAELNLSDADRYITEHVCALW